MIYLNGDVFSINSSSIMFYTSSCKELLCKNDHVKKAIECALVVVTVILIACGEKLQQAPVPD